MITVNPTSQLKWGQSLGGSEGSSVETATFLEESTRTISTDESKPTGAQLY
jgi:hypothetical protein